MPTIPCYERFELVLDGPSDGNPFTEVTFSARFLIGSRALTAPGFYDGEGIYRVRFMPDEPGEWHYTTHSNTAALDGQAGQFICTAPNVGNHGPVRVADQFHFAYADGTRYYPFGTTCYAWTHQGNALEEATLAELSRSPFNKIRMCVFPKHYRFNTNEPELYPFEKTATGWDFTRFNPAFFRHFEQRVSELGDLGIEADIILIHPYDRWGFSDMGRKADERYLHYITARLSAYHNVWWSLANEYDILLKKKPMQDWDHYFQVLQETDPHNHLRSIHNWQMQDTHDSRTFYDHRKPWVSHCSVQHGFVDLVRDWRETYGKPVVVDECCYEGNIPNGWGNITGEEMVRRHWEAALRGGYAGHGETFLDSDDVIWWSKGGKLHGQSPQRLAFLRQVIESLDGGVLEPLGRVSDTNLPSAGQKGKYYLSYFGFRQPGQMTFDIAEEGRYRVEVIDTWEMTITPLEETFEETCTIELPSKPYMAVLAKRVNEI